MTAIINFFSGIVDTIKAVIDFVVGLFEDLVYVIKLLGEFVLEIPNYFSWLPPAALAVILVVFSIVVIYKVLGRS